MRFYRHVVQVSTGVPRLPSTLKHNPEKTRDQFHKSFGANIWNLGCEHYLYFNKNSGDAIMPWICTCHDSIATLWWSAHHFSTNMHMDFTGFRSWAYNPSVKQVPVLCMAPNSTTGILSRLRNCADRALITHNLVSAPGWAYFEFYLSFRVNAILDCTRNKFSLELSLTLVALVTHTCIWELIR